MLIRCFAFLGLLAVLSFGAGCAGGSADGGSPSPTSTDPAQCTEAYAFAPAAYVIHIVSGDAVILDPLSNDFQLFCDAQSAAKGLEQELAAGRLPSGDWKVYRVYGEWSDLATEVSPGVFLLNKPAPIVDWVN